MFVYELIIYGNMGSRPGAMKKNPPGQLTVCEQQAFEEVHQVPDLDVEYIRDSEDEDTNGGEPDNEVPQDFTSAHSEISPDNIGGVSDDGDDGRSTIHVQLPSDKALASPLNPGRAIQDTTMDTATGSEPSTWPHIGTLLEQLFDKSKTSHTQYLARSHQAI